MKQLQENGMVEQCIPELYLQNKQWIETCSQNNPCEVLKEYASDIYSGSASEFIENYKFAAQMGVEYFYTPEMKEGLKTEIQKLQAALKDPASCAQMRAVVPVEIRKCMGQAAELVLKPQARSFESSLREFLLKTSSIKFELDPADVKQCFDPELSRCSVLDFSKAAVKVHELTMGVYSSILCNPLSATPD
jgi:hypothetical protein